MDMLSGTFDSYKSEPEVYSLIQQIQAVRVDTPINDSTEISN